MKHSWTRHFIGPLVAVALLIIGVYGAVAYFPHLILGAANQFVLRSYGYKLQAEEVHWMHGVFSFHGIKLSSRTSNQTALSAQSLAAHLYLHEGRLHCDLHLTDPQIQVQPELLASLFPSGTEKDSSFFGKYLVPSVSIQRGILRCDPKQWSSSSTTPHPLAPSEITAIFSAQWKDCNGILTIGEENPERILFHQAQIDGKTSCKVGFDGFDLAKMAREITVTNYLGHQKSFQRYLSSGQVHGVISLGTIPVLEEERLVINDLVFQLPELNPLLGRAFSLNIPLLHLNKQGINEWSCHSKQSFTVGFGENLEGSLPPLRCTGKEFKAAWIPDEALSWSSILDLNHTLHALTYSSNDPEKKVDWSIKKLAIEEPTKEGTITISSPSTGNWLQFLWGLGQEICGPEPLFCQVEVSEFIFDEVFQLLRHFYHLPSQWNTFSIQRLDLRGELQWNPDQTADNALHGWNLHLKNCSLENVSLPLSNGQLQMQSIAFDGNLSLVDLLPFHFTKIAEAAEGIVIYKEGIYRENTDDKEISLPPVIINNAEVYLQKGSISNSWIQGSCGSLEGNLVIRDYNGEVGSATYQVAIAVDQQLSEQLIHQKILSEDNSWLNSFMGSYGMVTGSFLWVNAKEQGTLQGTLSIDGLEGEKSIEIPFQSKITLAGLSEKGAQPIKLSGWEVAFRGEEISSQRFIEPFLFSKRKEYHLGGTVSIEGKLTPQSLDLHYLPKNLTLITPFFEIHDSIGTIWADYHVSFDQKRNWGQIPLMDAELIDLKHGWKFERLSGIFTEEEGFFQVKNLKGNYEKAEFSLDMAIALTQKELQAHAYKYQGILPQTVLTMAFNQITGDVTSLQTFLTAISAHSFWKQPISGQFTIPPNTSSMEIAFLPEGVTNIESQILLWGQELQLINNEINVAVPALSISYNTHYDTAENHIRIHPCQGLINFTHQEKEGQEAILLSLQFTLDEINLNLKYRNDKELSYPLNLALFPQGELSGQGAVPLIQVKGTLLERKNGTYNFSLAEPGLWMGSYLQTLSLDIQGDKGITNSQVKGQIDLEKCAVNLLRMEKSFLGMGKKVYATLLNYLEKSSGTLDCFFTSSCNEKNSKEWEISFLSNSPIGYREFHFNTLHSVWKFRSNHYICERLELDDLFLQGAILEVSPKVWKLEGFDIVWGDHFECSGNAFYDHHYEKLRLEVSHSVLRWEQALQVSWLEKWSQLFPGQGEVEAAGEIILDEIATDKLPTIVDYELFLRLEEFSLGDIYYTTTSPLKIRGDGEQMIVEGGELSFFSSEKSHRSESELTKIRIEQADLDIEERKLHLHKLQLDFFPEELSVLIAGLPTSDSNKRIASKLLGKFAPQQPQKWSGEGSYSVGGEWTFHLTTPELSISPYEEAAPGSLIKLSHVQLNANQELGTLWASHEITSYPVIYESDIYWKEARGILSIRPMLSPEELELLEEEEGMIPQIDLHWHRDLAALKASSEILIDSIQGCLPGIYVDFFSKDTGIDKQKQILFGTLKIDLIKSKPLISSIAPYLLSPRAMQQKDLPEIRLVGDLALFPRAPHRSHFTGEASATGGCLYFPYHHLNGQLTLSLDQIELKNIEIHHFNSKARVPAALFKRNSTQQWEMAIPKVVCYDLYPKQVTDEFLIENGMCISYIELADLKGLLRQTKTWTGHGSLSFEKRTKKHWVGAIFLFPKELLSALSLGSDVATPIQGAFNFTIRDQYFYLGQLLNTYSERKKAQFFLTTLADVPIDEQNRIDFDGNLSLAVRIKQRTLLKLGQLFLVQINGNIKKPVYRLRSNKHSR